MNFLLSYLIKNNKSNVWFNKKDLDLHDVIKVKNLHGYILPHASTYYTGHILSHTLRFRPEKDFQYILIIYYPSQNKPNIENEYHEYYVLLKTLSVFFPDKIFIGFNLRSKTNPNISKLNKQNTMYVVSVDFSHFLSLNEAIEKENCAAHAMFHRDFTVPCTRVIDNIQGFRLLYRLLPEITIEWVGRTRSPGEKGVGYLSFLIRDEPNLSDLKPDGFFVTAYDRNMTARECLGNLRDWNIELEKNLKESVISKAGTTSRLTGEDILNIPITNYTITYLYKDTDKKFIRGWHAILKDAFYLSNVFWRIHIITGYG